MKRIDIDLDALVDEVIAASREAERKRSLILIPCSHCGRKLRAEPGTIPICKRCAKLPGHSPEDRLMRAIFGKETDCAKCREARIASN